MKSFSIALILSLSLTFVFAEHGPTDEEVEKAVRECNATNPVQRDPILVMVQALYEGELLNLSGVEKCFLNCLYQKLTLYDRNSAINMCVMKDWMSDSSDFEYSVMVATAEFLNGATRSFENKCERGFVNSFQLLIQQLVSESINPSIKITSPKNQINHSLENGKPALTLLQPKVKRPGFFGGLPKRSAQKQQNTSNGQWKVSHGESPLQQQDREIQYT